MVNRYFGVGSIQNMVDLRIAEKEIGWTMAKKHGFEYIETSAETGRNVDALFRLVMKVLVSERLRRVQARLG